MEKGKKDEKRKNGSHEAMQDEGRKRWRRERKTKSGKVEIMKG